MRLIDATEYAKHNRSRFFCRSQFFWVYEFMTRCKSFSARL